MNCKVNRFGLVEIQIEVKPELIGDIHLITEREYILPEKKQAPVIVIKL